MLTRQVRELIGDEGIRHLVYDDANGQVLRPGRKAVGHPTIGIGRALDTHGITDGEAKFLLQNDIARVEQALRAHPWFSGLDAVRQGVVTNLAFNIGLSGVLHFERMIAALADGDYTAAANELGASKWASQVQSSRSSRLIGQMLTGRLDGQMARTTQDAG